MPNIVRKEQDNTSSVLSITITRDELKPLVQQELKSFRQRANIRGFRQGQAPVDFVKRMYGSSIVSETINRMFSDELMRFLRESQLDILGQPMLTGDIKPFSFKIDQLDEEYTIHYEVGYVGAFELQGLDKNQTFERLTVSDLDALAEKDLEYARKRMGGRTNPENDIQDNDLLKVAARELDGDNIKADGWETTMTIFLQNIGDESLKTQLLGLKKGDTLRFNARGIEKQEKEEMYRKYILNLPADDNRAVGDWFEGTIEEVSRVGEAELNEEFFTGYFGEGRVNSKEEAVDALKGGILEFYDSRAEALLMRSFQERLLELNRVELPENFLKNWLKATNEGRLTDEQIEQELPAFLENLRWTVIRDRIKEMLVVEVSDEDVRQEFRTRLLRYFQAELPENVIDSALSRMMKDQKEVKKVQDELEWDKLTNAIRREVSIVDKPVPSEEFQKIVDEISNKAKSEQAQGQLV